MPSTITRRRFLQGAALDIDPNASVWASTPPDYRLLAPLQEDIRADLAIIGGGFTGVSTAYHFSRRYPDKRVVLLEARSLANGASGRSGGQMLNWIYGIDDDQAWRALPIVEPSLTPVPPEPLRWLGAQLYMRLQGASRRGGLF